MSFKEGDKIHLHGGGIVKVGKHGVVPTIARGPDDQVNIRGFVRAALIEPDGREHDSDWYENVVTQFGHQHIVRNFVGLAFLSNSGSSSMAANLTDLALARYWGLGYHTQGQSSNFSTQASMDSSEYGLASTGGTSRASVSAGQQVLSGTWTLQQSFAYASSQISHGVTVNCIAQYANATVGQASSL